MEHPFAAQASGERPRRRDYEKVLELLEKRWRRRPRNRGRMMQDIADSLWDVFGEKVFSWCGFYSPDADGNKLSLGPHRPQPPGAAVGISSVCGNALKGKTSQIAAGLQKPGETAGESRPDARSEIAVPVIDLRGNVFAVLNIQSKEPGVFGEEDRRWLERILKELAQSPSPDSGTR